MKLLKLLLPSFFAAYKQGQTQAFFEHTYQVWFLCFPNPEHQIAFNEDFSEDLEYMTFIRKQREKVHIFIFRAGLVSHTFYLHSGSEGRSVGCHSISHQ